MGNSTTSIGGGAAVAALRYDNVGQTVASKARPGLSSGSLVVCPLSSVICRVAGRQARGRLDGFHRLCGFEEQHHAIDGER